MKLSSSLPEYFAAHLQRFARYQGLARAKPPAPKSVYTDLWTRRPHPPVPAFKTCGSLHDTFYSTTSACLLASSFLVFCCCPHGHDPFPRRQLVQPLCRIAVEHWPVGHHQLSRPSTIGRAEQQRKPGHLKARTNTQKKSVEGKHGNKFAGKRAPKGERERHANKRTTQHGDERGHFRHI